MSVLSDLGLTHPLWKNFVDISRIPRCSGNCSEIRGFIISYAERYGFDHSSDDEGNILVKIPASESVKDAETLALQVHMDMVCVKASGLEHDFSKDFLSLYREGAWLRARGTTLGADNGIGLAVLLTLMEKISEFEHGPLEFLFTVDEEIGLVGALAILPQFLSARFLLNLDSTDEYRFVLGSAGMMANTMAGFVQSEEAPSSGKFFSLHLSGLEGGHSGMQIHEGLANALSLLTQIWDAIHLMGGRLSAFRAEGKMNVIPSEGTLVFYWPHSEEELSTLVKDWKVRFSFENRKEKNVCFDLKYLPTRARVMVPEEEKRFCAFFSLLPTGVLQVFENQQVSFSNNWASALIDATRGEFRLGISTRYALSSQKELMQRKLLFLEQAFSLPSFKEQYAYGAWEPSWENTLVDIARELTPEFWLHDAEFMTIHAGLECGLLVDKHEGMVALSTGPLIEHLHTIEERVHTGSVETFWQFLVKFIEKFSEQKKVTA